MKWLAQLHKDWMMARKRRIGASLRGFRRDWEQLLEDAGITSAEEQNSARREAERTPQIRLIPRKRNPRFIDKIELPPESEAWLHERFQTRPASEAQAHSLEVLAEWSARSHPLHAEEWSRFCRQLEYNFKAPRVCGPFDWQDEARVAELLGWLFELTSNEWPQGTLIRDASTRLGLGSKVLEEEQSAIERALTLMFERDMPLEALGIQTSNSVLHFSGPLTLHFEDGSMHVTDALRFESTLSFGELDRAVRITTTADRLLTIENRKTSFVQFARADRLRSTLIVASSYPTQAVRSLLKLLPLELEHHHFGDTDVWGYEILRSLRLISQREVRPFCMKWRPADAATALTKREQSVLARLISDPLMRDCHMQLRQMQCAGNRGDFEQESLGPPTLSEWPWFVEVASLADSHPGPARGSFRV